MRVSRGEVLEEKRVRVSGGEVLESQEGQPRPPPWHVEVCFEGQEAPGLARSTGHGLLQLYADAYRKCVAYTARGISNCRSTSKPARNQDRRTYSRGRHPWSNVRPAGTHAEYSSITGPATELLAATDLPVRK